MPSIRKRMRKGDKIVMSNGVEVFFVGIGFDNAEVLITAPQNVKIDTPMGAETKGLKEMRAARKAGKSVIPQPTVPQPIAPQKWKPISHGKLHTRTV